MNKLSQRLDRLESREVAPAAVAEAARQFECELQAMAARMPQSHDQANDAQMALWSPAQRAAWRMRFRGETMAHAIAAVGFLPPPEHSQAALRRMDHLDLGL